MIEARGLTKRFGKIIAVDNVDLSMGSSGIVGFLGPNGAGKTTTMRMLTGFLPMNEGTAVVAGYDVFEDPLQVKARVGYLPEAPPLYPELTVGEYLRFISEIRGVPRKRRAARIGEVMERVGLTGWEQRLTGSLSKGFRQRVGLAQAMMHDPPLLILDEPTSGLDPAQLVSVRALIRKLAEDRAVLLSTHVLQEVEMLCDRVVLIHRGRIVGDDSVETLASSVGAGSWLELDVEGTDGDVSRQLAQLAEVVGVERLDDRRYRLTGGEDLAPAVAKLAVESGWRVHALAHHRASLEEVFLGLVGADA